MNTLLSRWLPVVVWMGIIFFLSAQPSLPRIGTPPIQFLLSKTAHFLEYLVLALLLVRAQGTQADHRWRTYVTAFLLVVAYAASDEFHQSLVPNRRALLIDVGIDAVGAAAGLLVVRFKERQREVQRE